MNLELSSERGDAGCSAMLALYLLILVALGAATVTKNGNVLVPADVVAIARAPSGPVGPLPDVGVNGPTTTTTLAPVAPVPVAPVPQAPVPNNAPTDAGSGLAGPTDNGNQTAPPPAPPPAPCGYPTSIGVSGGNPSVLDGSGGTSTVTSLPFVLSTPALVNCGQHYQLQFRASGGSSGYDCKTDGFSTNVSALLPSLQVGETVDVTLLRPPNQCG